MHAPPPDSPIDIRALTPADAESYTRLRREMLIDSPWAFGDTPEEDTSLDPAQIARRLANPTYIIVGAFATPAPTLTNTPASTPTLIAAAGLLRDPRSKLAHNAHIWGVYVTPPFRARGIGKRIMHCAIDIARTWPGTTMLRLSASARSTEAIRLYHHLGFQTWGTEPALLMLDGPAIDEVHMTLAIAPPQNAQVDSPKG